MFNGIYGREHGQRLKAGLTTADLRWAFCQKQASEIFHLHERSLHLQIYASGVRIRDELSLPWFHTWYFSARVVHPVVVRTGPAHI